MRSYTMRGWRQILRRSWQPSLLLLKRSSATDYPASGHVEISGSVKYFNISKFKRISCKRSGVSPGMCHGEGEERCHMLQSGSGPPVFFRNVPVSSTWLYDSGTKPSNNKRPKADMFQARAVYAKVRRLCKKKSMYMS